jgi:hypothetical protein
LADGINIDPGTTTEVATDDCGAAGHTQIVKLAVSTDGSATLIPADTTSGLLVNVSEDSTLFLDAGDNTIGRVQLRNAADTAAMDRDEDSEAFSGDALFPVGGVRRDTPSTTTSTDGDYTPLTFDSSNRLWVNVGAGSAGGTQYTEADTDASITGTAVMWEDTSDTLRAVSAAKPLPVGDAGGSLTVDNGGTFAVQESGGSLTALQIIDDWDESDRAKVNPIVGQAGVAAGAGAVSATVQRTTLASDDPAVALLGTIDADTGNIVTAVQIMDDWDESDRAKVNLIVGQAGIAAGAGAVGATVPRVTLASDDPAVVSLAALDNAVSGNELQVDVVAALPAGTNAIGKLAANSGVDIGDVDVTSISAGTNSIGGVFLRPETANGLDTFHSNDLDETEEDVKTSAGQVYGWIITNRTTAPVYVHFYNATAASVTVGTTAPLFNFAVPGNATDYVAAHLLAGMGIAFGTAISVAATTDFPDDGSPAGPATNGVLCTIFYK